MERRERCSRGRPEQAPAERVETLERFLSGLKDPEKVLIQVKESLYEGSWDRLAGDLQARLEGRPYVFKLAGVIRRDLESIRRMRQFEEKAGCSLAKELRERERLTGA